jgi:hypothetical protein
MMYRRKYYLIVLLAIAVALSAINLMDDQSRGSFLWFGGGGGALGTDDGTLSEINASLNYSKNAHIFKLRAIHTAEMTLLELFEPSQPNDEVWELGLLYGLRPFNDIANISFHAGISYTGGSYKGDRLDSGYYEVLTFGTVGLPLEIQFNAKLLEYVGFSIILFADINPDKSYGGVNFAILLGQLPGLTGTTHFKRFQSSLY